MAFPFLRTAAVIGIVGACVLILSGLAGLDFATAFVVAGIVCLIALLGILSCLLPR